MTEFSARWYVVQTHFHSEEKVASHLIRQGYPVYLPRYLKRCRPARRVETVSAPVFPRYLFVAFDRMAQRWRAIQSTVGVTSLVCNGGEPARVPESVMSELRSREDESGFVQLDSRPQFALGDRIRVVAGVFETCLGLYDGMADRERAAVLLDLLGRKVRVVLHGGVVAAA